MCCCCPPAISAIFCLWVQSGFSKGTVAGALTFFPPDPPLYKFERFDKDGNILPEINDDDDDDDNDDDSDSDNDDDNDNDDNEKKNKKKKKGSGSGNGTETAVNGGEVIDRGDDRNGNNGDASTGVEVVTDGAYQAREGQTKEKVRSPAQQFTDQARELRIRGKKRNVRDTKDAANKISYRLILDPRLQPPRFHNGGTVDAVKIPTGKNKNKSSKSKPESESESEESTPKSTSKSKSSKAKAKSKAKDKKIAQSISHCAAIVYKVPSTNLETTSQGKKTMTIIYSHGNATDIGAMYPLQAILSNSLECNVVSYDYSGYGESGGTAMESNTYTDIAGVYEWTLENVCFGDESRIILYGQSVGSGPCCHLSQKIDGLGGMILHSPFMSGMRVLTPSRYVYSLFVIVLHFFYQRWGRHNPIFMSCISRTLSFYSFFYFPSFCSFLFLLRTQTLTTYSALACLDIYPNIDRVCKTKCPVMVIHGRLDEEVDISHGTSMHQAVPNHCKRDPWWVPDRGHNDITEGPGKLVEYVGRLRSFMESLD